VISWLTSGSGWGTREQAIPGEWAALVLIMVLGALLGLLVLWFTVLRHERTVRHRATLRPDGLVAFTGIGAAADEKATPPEPDLEDAGEVETDVRAEIADVADVAEEPAAGEEDEAGEEEIEGRATKQSAQSVAASQPPAGSGKRKLTDEILSRVETELAVRETPRWKDLAELVRQEFGVTVHPSSIQKAVKRRRLVAAQGGTGGVGGMTSTTEVAAPAPEPASAASAATRTEPENDVRPNGGRRPMPWASPACPAADAG
jgi:hypothetical protein